jgi:hypothetical protein
VEHAAKVFESVLVPFQESLLRGIRIGSVKCPSTAHAPHREKLQSLHLPI